MGYFILAKFLSLMHGHHTKQRATAFMRTIPRWHSCSSEIRASLPGVGNITRGPHIRHPACTEKSPFRRKYTTHSSLGESGHPCWTNPTIAARSGSMRVHVATWAAVTGNFSRVVIDNTSSAGNGTSVGASLICSLLSPSPFAILRLCRKHKWYWQLATGERPSLNPSTHHGWNCSVFS